MILLLIKFKKSQGHWAHINVPWTGKDTKELQMPRKDCVTADYHKEYLRLNRRDWHTFIPVKLIIV